MHVIHKLPNEHLGLFFFRLTEESLFIIDVICLRAKS